MNLKLHGPMGDHLVLTGIPEAYYRIFGEKTYVPHQYASEFWKDNPFISKKPLGQTYSIAFNSGPKDYMIYYPVRVFYDISGYIVDRSLVQPNLYLPRTPLDGFILINDQAGWPSRKGYPHFNALCRSLMDHGWRVVYLRNEGYRDCIGQESPRQITNFLQEIRNPSISHMISAVRSCQFYIGYDSGISQLAGALKIPYVMLSGSVPPINTAHDTCIYALKLPTCKRCFTDTCHEGCIKGAGNENGAILEAINGYRG